MIPPAQRGVSAGSRMYFRRGAFPGRHVAVNAVPGVFVDASSAALGTVEDRLQFEQQLLRGVRLGEKGFNAARADRNPVVHIQAADANDLERRSDLPQRAQGGG